MFSLRSHLLIAGALFVALIGLPMVAAVLQRAGVSPPTGTARYAVGGVYLLIFVAFGFSAVPVIVKLVLGTQERLGNADVGAVATAIKHQNRIIWIMWGVMGAGMLVAIPAAILGGAFGDAPQRAVNRMFEGSKLGVLAVRPDMSLDELVRGSTLKLDLRYARSAISAGGLFDFSIPGTGITFENARYYYMTTYSDDATRIRTVNVGVSREKTSLASIDSADAALRTRLAADGWLAGHEVYRTAEDQALHGGATEGPEGRHWMKNDMILTIARNRVDEEKQGEAADAGEWIQYVDLWPAKDWPGFERFVFQAAK